MEQFAFNIRVYGLLVKNRQILLTDEVYSGMRMTKFPGGGLEYGEGPADTLRRELKEELSLLDFKAEHFYTTDFFQASAFHKNRQLISIYYLVTDFDPSMLSLMPDEPNGVKTFFFISLNELTENDLTFPIDKKVVKLLKEKLEVE